MSYFYYKKCERLLQQIYNPYKVNIKCCFSSLQSLPVSEGDRESYPWIVFLPQKQDQTIYTMLCSLLLYLNSES